MLKYKLYENLFEGYKMIKIYIYCVEQKELKNAIIFISIHTYNIIKIFITCAIGIVYIFLFLFLETENKYF